MGGVGFKPTFQNITQQRAWFKTNGYTATRPKRILFLWWICIGYKFWNWPTMRRIIKFLNYIKPMDILVRIKHSQPNAVEWNYYVVVTLYWESCNYVGWLKAHKGSFTNKVIKKSPFFYPLGLSPSSSSVITTRPPPLWTKHDVIMAWPPSSNFHIFRFMLFKLILI